MDVQIQSFKHCLLAQKEHFTHPLGLIRGMRGVHQKVVNYVGAANYKFLFKSININSNIGIEKVLFHSKYNIIVVVSHYSLYIYSTVTWKPVAEVEILDPRVWNNKIQDVRLHPTLPQAIVVSRQKYVNLHMFSVDLQKYHVITKVAITNSNPTYFIQLTISKDGQYVVLSQSFMNYANKSIISMYNCNGLKPALSDPLEINFRILDIVFGDEHTRLYMCNTSAAYKMSLDLETSSYRLSNIFCTLLQQIQGLEVLTTSSTLIVYTEGSLEFFKIENDCPRWVGRRIKPFTGCQCHPVLGYVVVTDLHSSTMGFSLYVFDPSRIEKNNFDLFSLFGETHIQTLAFKWAFHPKYPVAVLFGNHPKNQIFIINLLQLKKKSIKKVLT